MQRLLVLILFTATTIAPRLAVAQKNFLWQIGSKTNTGYLLGSIHVAKKDFYPLPAPIVRAYNAAQVLVLEARTDKAAELQQMVMQHAMYVPPDSLEKHLSAKNLALVNKKLEVLKLPTSAFLRFKPWFLAVTLAALELKKLGYQPELGIDAYFLSQATQEKKSKPIVELEGAEFQLKLFTGLSDALQEDFLLYSLAQAKLIGSFINRIASYWKRGDHRQLDRLMSESFRKEKKFRGIYRLLITERNKTMAQKIDQLMKSNKSHFIVVGAGHLTGAEGVVKLLQKMGYKLTQL